MCVTLFASSTSEPSLYSLLYVHRLQVPDSEEAVSAATVAYHAQQSASAIIPYLVYIHRELACMVVNG